MKKSGKASTGKSGQIDSLHVTFAEHPDQYVINSDSGIFLANDDVTTDILETNKCDKLQKANKPVRPILKLQKCVSVESQDNPFLRDGELMRKAEYIINNSTFSRKRIRIADPDLMRSSSEPNHPNRQISPDTKKYEIVQIGGVELTCLSKDDLVVMEICSSDSNRDQSSSEDVRSLTTSDRSPHRHVLNSPEIRDDANVLSSDVHDRLLVNLPEDDNDPHLETSKPLLPHQTSDRQHQLSAQKPNGENLQQTSQPQNYSHSNEILTSAKPAIKFKSKKKKKCCLLQ